MMQDTLSAMLQATTPVAGNGIGGWLFWVDIVLATACVGLGVLCWWVRARQPLKWAAGAPVLMLMGAFLASFGAAQLVAMTVQSPAHNLLAGLLKLSSVVFAAAGLIVFLLTRARTNSLPDGANTDTNAAAQELSRCQNEFDQFVYSASHDLREPLQGIQNYTAFLTEDFAAQLGEDGCTRLRTIAGLAARMDRQLDALHTLSRIARAPWQPVATDLTNIAQAAHKRQQDTVGLRADAVVIERLPVVDCDPEWVTELLSQLITNALLFNTDATQSIIVGQQGHDEFGHAVIFVRDSGVGIEARHHDDVFNLFRRLHGRDDYGGGIGAGLTIARKIVERHGGRIWLESQPGAGTTVMFTLGARSLT